MDVCWHKRWAWVIRQKGYSSTTWPPCFPPVLFLIYHHCSSSKLHIIKTVLMRVCCGPITTGHASGSTAKILVSKYKREAHCCHQSDNSSYFSLITIFWTLGVGMFHFRDEVAVWCRVLLSVMHFDMCSGWTRSQTRILWSSVQLLEQLIHFTTLHNRNVLEYWKSVAEQSSTGGRRAGWVEHGVLLVPGSKFNQPLLKQPIYNRSA